MLLIIIGAAIIFGDDSSKNELKKVLMQSIKRQQISDVPIGTFLSGGIDSTFLSAFIKKRLNRDLEHITIGCVLQGCVRDQIRQVLDGQHRAAGAARLPGTRSRRQGAVTSLAAR